MILPTKGIESHRALLAVGAEVLRLLDEPKTVSRLWHDFDAYRTPEVRITFDWFVLAVDVLHALGVVELERGRLARVSKEAA